MAPIIEQFELAFEKGKIRIFLFISIVTIIAANLDLYTFYEVYNFQLKAARVAGIMSHVFILTIFFLNIYTDSKTLILLTTWTALFGLTIPHLFIFHEIFSKIDMQLIFCRDALFIICAISVSGLMGNIKNAIAQLLLFLIDLTYQTFFNGLIYIQDNFGLYVIVGIGYTITIGFFVYYLQVFVKTLDDHKHILEKKNKDITASINYAKTIQAAILPPRKLVKEFFHHSFIIYQPKDIIAGDFYWMETRNGKLFFAVADCTGHGVPGAMVSVICNNGLNRSIYEYHLNDPGKILDKTREIVIQGFEKSEREIYDGMDIALCAFEGNNLQYAGANNPLWIIRDGKLIEIKADKQPIGNFDLQDPYTTHTVALQKDDCLYLFSDGIVAQFGGPEGKKFKPQAFRKLLLSIQNEPMRRQKELIIEAFEKWKGDANQVDDVCVIGVRI